MQEYNEQLIQYKQAKHDPEYVFKRRTLKSPKKKPIKLIANFFSWSTTPFILGHYATIKDAENAIHSFTRAGRFCNFKIESSRESDDRLSTPGTESS